MNCAQFFLEDFYIESVEQKDSYIDISPDGDATASDIRFNIKEDATDESLLEFCMNKKRAIAFARCIMAIADLY